MPFQVFSTANTYTWDWPDDITHATFKVWAAGGGGRNGSTPTGGGGGGGGAFVGGDIYRGFETGLEVRVGSGGIFGANGGFSRIQLGGTELLRANGGSGATSATGGAGGTPNTPGPDVVGGGGTNGGAGGDGQINRGGGGGAGAGYGGNGNDGGDGAPAGDGLGGNAPTGGGAGGNGGVFGVGQDAPQKGGGGGGGGTLGSAGGRGHDGLVVIAWGLQQGITLFSSGCCCGSCDLAPMFPHSVLLQVDFNAANNPAFDPGTRQDDSDFRAPQSCEPPDPPLVEFVPPECDTNEENNSLVEVFNDATDLNLEMTSFESGVLVGVSPLHHYCRATYECPLSSASIDDGSVAGQGLLDLYDRWCLVGDFDEDFTSTDTTLSLASFGFGEADGNDCEYSTTYVWARFREVWIKPHVTLTLARRFSTAKFYYQVETTVSFYSKFSDGRYTTHTDGSPAVGDPGPSDDDWRAVALGAATSDTALTGPYDTAEEALEAAMSAMTLTSGGGIVSGSWSLNTFVFFDFHRYDETAFKCVENNGEVDELWFCVVLDEASFGWHYECGPLVQQWYSNPSRLGATWTHQA